MNRKLKFSDYESLYPNGRGNHQSFNPNLRGVFLKQFSGGGGGVIILPPQIDQKSGFKDKSW